MPGMSDDWRESDESLRRRLYDADASEADLQRYRDLLAARLADRAVAPPAVDVIEVAAPEAPPAPPHRLLRWGTAAAVVAIAVTVGVVLFVTRPEPAPAPTTVAIDGQTRSDFIAQLGTGGAAGIAAYLVTHPTPPGMRGATRFDTVEVHGVGSATKTLGRPATGTDLGRATVLVVTASAADLTWTAAKADGTPLASRGGTLLAGALTTATFRYAAGSRPQRLVIDVPDGVRWGAAVVYSD